MLEEASSHIQKMSNEEIGEAVQAMHEFTSTHPWEVLRGITGLQIARGSIEERLSNRKPPLEITPDAEIIAIDECLGLYRPKRKQIVLFQRGIASGHYAYYGIAGNFRALQRVHRAVERYWRKMLSSRSWKGEIWWKPFQQIKTRFPLLRPKLYLPYAELQAVATL